MNANVGGRTTLPPKSCETIWKRYAARSARSSRTHQSRRSFPRPTTTRSACSISDEHGVSLVARAQSVPVHIFAALTSVETILKTYRGDIHEGDLFLACDPYYGGSHIPDWTVVKPVFVDGEPRFFTSVRGHVNDVGGCAPGGYNTIGARDLAGRLPRAAGAVARRAASRSTTSGI